MDFVEVITQTFRNLGPVRMATIAAVMLGVIGFFLYLVSRTSGDNMSLLYNQLEMSDSTEIVQKLETMGVPLELRNNGTQIFVPTNRVAQLRMMLAQEGLPNSGGIGYEIFDRDEGLGVSVVMMDIKRLRALEGELAKSIRSIKGIQAARVHLVLPKRELFSRERTEPSASVIVKLKGKGTLGNPQIQSIQYLVSSAVPRLNTNKVAVVDDKGNLLARLKDSDDPLANLSTQQEIKLAQEKRLATTIETLLEKSVGYGKVRAEINVDMDFDRITTNSEEYNPEGQVARSTTTAQEDAASTEKSLEDSVSVDAVVPDQGPSKENSQKLLSSDTKRNEETVNYEISRTVKTHVRESGVVERISVAVLIDGNYTTDAQGNNTYAPRTQEELDKLSTLVKSAIGYREERGDSVEVINMQFAPVDVETAIEEESFLSSPVAIKALELIILAVVGLLILLMVVRPLLMKMLDTQSMGQGELDFDEGQDLLGMRPNNTLAKPAQADSADDEEIDLDHIQGGIKASVVKKVSETIDSNPEQAVNLLRSWMQS